VAATEVILLFIVMFMKDRYLLNRVFWGSILRIVSVTGFSVVTAFIMVSLLPLGLGDRGIITLGAKFVSIAGVTFIVHIGMSLLFGLEEPKPVIRKLRQILFKPVRI
jgi:hypothetical protein